MDAASAELLARARPRLPRLPWLVAVTRRDERHGLRRPPRAAPWCALEPAPLAADETLALAERRDRERPAAAARRGAGRRAVRRQPAVPARPAARGRRRRERPAREHRGGGDGAASTAWRPRPRARAARRGARRSASTAPARARARRRRPAARRGDVGRGCARYFADDGDGHLRFRRQLVRDAAYAGLPFRDAAPPARRRRRAARAELGAVGRRGGRPALAALLLARATTSAPGATRACAGRPRARALRATPTPPQLYRRALEAGRTAPALRPRSVSASVGGARRGLRPHRRARRGARRRSPPRAGSPADDPRPRRPSCCPRHAQVAERAGRRRAGGALGARGLRARSTGCRAGGGGGARRS